jgi:hypothetical protein
LRGLGMKVVITVGSNPMVFLWEEMRHIHTEGWPREDTGRQRWPCTSQGERPQKETNPAHTLSSVFHLPELWENRFLSLQPRGLGCFVMASWQVLQSGQDRCNEMGHRCTRTWESVTLSSSVPGSGSESEPVLEAWMRWAAVESWDTDIVCWGQKRRWFSSGVLTKVSGAAEAPSGNLFDMQIVGATLIPESVMLGRGPALCGEASWE